MIRLLSGIDEVLTGGASGADSFGESIARSLGIPSRRFLPDWKKYGRAAGPIRNAEMARNADAVILLPGGKGTASMRAEARRSGLRILWDGAL